jgi:parallel beta-helix repeat protein
MACVVTVALIEDAQVTVGHVGDSRMYLLEPGNIRKVTRDHSPVGELEDGGKLSEAAAMAHPRRNEVFRDLGSEPHGPDDEEFIDVLRFPFRPNSALLLCSDGLSDQVTGEEIRRLVESFAGDPERAARALVEAANAAGGKDNVSVVLVEGPAYNAARPAAVPAIVPRRNARPLLSFLAGLVLAAALFALVRPYAVEGPDGMHLGRGTVRFPLTIKVGTGGVLTVAEAIKAAEPGDTILVEPGTYHENIRLESGIALISAHRHGAVLEGSEVVVLADGVHRSRISGFKIAGSAQVGVRIANSDLEVTDLEIGGMRETGIEVEGESPALIRANQIIGNPGVGIEVRGAARPVITNNVVTGNGRTPGALRPGIYILGAAVPTLAGNIVADSGVEQIWVSPLFNAETLLSRNFIAPGAKDRKNLIKVVTR